MKKTVIVILTMTIFSTYGQNHFVGVDAGISWMNIASKDFIKPSFKAGFTGGISYEYFFNENVSVGAGIIYHSRGYTIKSALTDSLGNTLKIKTKFDYVSLPLKLGFSYGKKFFGFAKVGVIPAILVKAEEDSRNRTNDIRRMDISGIFEIGAGYNITNRCRAKLSFSYQHGFSSITTDNYNPNIAIRNRGMNLVLGLSWAITTKSRVENEE
jgi:hypothetical protein